MCDYSLHSVASRPAKANDRLVSTKFSNSGTHGFSSVGEPNVAVCLLPGTEVAFDQEVRYDPGWSLLPARSLAEKVARFAQVNKDSPHVHHDALTFPSGETVLVNDLCVGQRLTVLQMPVAAHMANDVEQYRRASTIG